MTMAKFSVLVLLVSTALAGSPPSIPDPVVEAMPSIERANSEWSRAMKSGDANAIAVPYAIDAVFVTVGGDRVRGRAAIRDLYCTRLNGKSPVVPASIKRGGAVAGDRGLVYEWGRGTVIARSASGTEETRGGPYLTVWKRQEGGRWEIIRSVVL
jgi:uncharacterized protein (TIGR02246 family)